MRYVHKVSILLTKAKDIINHLWIFITINLIACILLYFVALSFAGCKILYVKYACKIVCTNSVAVRAVDSLALRTFNITLCTLLYRIQLRLDIFQTYEKQVEMISWSIEILCNRDRDITAISGIKTDRANKHQRTICLNTFASTRHMCDLPVSIERLASHICDSSDFSFYVIEWNLSWTQLLKQLNIWRRYLLYIFFLMRVKPTMGNWVIHW